MENTLSPVNMITVKKTVTVTKAQQQLQKAAAGTKALSAFFKKSNSTN
jgi:hypothetical protein